VSSLQLYENLGFIREKRLFNFYLNGKDCFRLILEIPKEYWVEKKALQGATPTRLPNGGDSPPMNLFDGLHVA
jgi:peptide alpha-N-acetyltransferase